MVPSMNSLLYIALNSKWDKIIYRQGNDSPISLGNDPYLPEENEIKIIIWASKIVNYRMYFYYYSHFLNEKSPMAWHCLDNSIMLSYTSISFTALFPEESLYKMSI